MTTLAARFLLHENVDAVRWGGVVLIISAPCSSATARRPRDRRRRRRRRRLQRNNTNQFVTFFVWFSVGLAGRLSPGSMAPSTGTLTGKAAYIGFLLGICVLLSACNLGPKRIVKAQGICTVAENAEAVTFNVLGSKRAAGYLPQTRFGPGEQPMAVVVGYGGKAASLELVALDTGRSLGSKTLDSNPGEASFQPGVLVETSGNYELRLLVDGVQRDACRFSVTRTNAPATPQRAIPEPTACR